MAIARLRRVCCRGPSWLMGRWTWESRWWDGVVWRSSVLIPTVHGWSGHRKGWRRERTCIRSRRNGRSGGGRKEGLGDANQAEAANWPWRDGRRRSGERWGDGRWGVFGSACGAREMACSVSPCAPCSRPVLGGPRDRGEALSHEGALDMGLVGYGHKQTGVRVYGCTEACGERGMRLARLDTGTLVSTALGRRADGAGGRMLWVEGQKGEAPGREAARTPL